MAEPKHRRPGGQSGTCQGRRLGIAQVLWRVYQSTCLVGAVFLQGAVDGAAGIALHCVLGGGTGGPVLEETGGNPVTNLEVMNALSERRDGAGAIRQRHKVLLFLS